MPIRYPRRQGETVAASFRQLIVSVWGSMKSMVDSNACMLATRCRRRKHSPPRSIVLASHKALASPHLPPPESSRSWYYSSSMVGSLGWFWNFVCWLLFSNVSIDPRQLAAMRYIM